MPLPLTHVAAQTVWRATRHIARNMDRQLPQWWDNKELVSELLHGASPRVIRCWKQHIVQRRGY
jgi:hypothetical protein